MQKIKPLKIIFQSFEDFSTQSRLLLQKALRGEKVVSRKDTLIWASVEAYQQFMSDQKYAILAAIYRYHPKSIYQLAKILGRAQQNVSRDCELLEGHGFIRFEETEEGRKIKTPRLVFDYNAVMVCLPSVTYQVGFANAA